MPQSNRLLSSIQKYYIYQKITKWSMTTHTLSIDADSIKLLRLQDTSTIGIVCPYHSQYDKLLGPWIVLVYVDIVQPDMPDLAHT